MTINISRYVSINSAVIGAQIVATRQLIMNLFTTNAKLSPRTSATFSSAAEVGSFFGTTSEEYYRANTNYFGWTSKNNNTPFLIQFTRWSQTAVAGMVSGYQADLLVADWAAVTAGYIGLTIGNHTQQVGPIDFSAVSVLADVASTLQTAIQAVTAGGTDWTAATVSFANNTFTLTGGVVGAEAIAVQAGVGGTDISGAVITSGHGQLGWYPQESTVNGVYIPGALWSQGAAAETISQTLINATDNSNNFGTFGFCYTGINGSFQLTGVTSSSSATIPMTNTVGIAVGQFVTGTGITGGSTVLTITPNTNITISIAATASGTVPLTFSQGANTGLSIVQYVQAAAWNASLAPNFQFKLLVPVTAANATQWQSLLSGYDGVTITLTDYSAPVTVTSQYPEQCDGVIEAATNYNPGAINSVQNYMFQLFPLLRSLVASDSVASNYDALNINYIGLTQNAGQPISFYQRGKLQGAIFDSGVYANEQWLKSAMTAQIMNLLLTQSYVPANAQGLSQLTSISQSVIQQALQNGTISVGKTLTPIQISDIGAITKNNLAWTQVQNAGFYLVWTIVPSVTYPGEYQGNYLLVYSKNDVIRFVQGQDDLA